MKLLRALALLCAAWAVGTFAWLMWHRLGYPYDLEWMEGGQLTHSLRVLDHQPIYGPPSVDFISYLYTPFYPILLAGISKLTGLGYLLGRMVSLLSFSTALVFGYVFARREGGDRTAAACAMAIPVAAYVPTGQWYELARPDSLYLALVAVAILVGWWKRHSHIGGVICGILMITAFFTKQTASPFLVALGIAFLAVNWRVALGYGATLALVGVPLLYWANRSSDGWFWTYVFRLHQSHEFYRARAWLATPLWLLALLGPSVLLVPWAILRKRSPALLWITWFALAGAGVACVGFGTQWAHINALIPGVFFPSIAVGTAAGRLVAPTPPRLRPPVVFALLAGALLLAPGILVRKLGPSLPRDWAWHLHPSTGYDPRPYVPTARDRALGDALIERLKAAPGEVLIPFHPYYAHLAGKATQLHRMGVMDVHQPVRGLAEAIAASRYSLLIFDDKIDGNWQYWPHLLEKYAVSETLSGPRCVAGAQTQPKYVLTPKGVVPPADREP